MVDLDEVRGIVGLLPGCAFWGGSADQSPIKELRRAGWSADFAEPFDESEPEAFRLRGRLTGPVWASLPQTSQAAEHVGLVAGGSIGCSVKRWWATACQW